MATVSSWTPFGVALDITATNGGVTRTSATKYKVKINVSWKSHYSGAETTYAMSASSGGVTEVISKYNSSGHTSGSSTLTGTYGISGAGSATKEISVTFKNYNSEESATKKVTFDVTVPAWCTLTYNANGGSGAPSSQSAASGSNVTISSTKPSRSYYTFLGWATSSTATSAGYVAGNSYKLSSNATLYAVWRANTYTITYNANSGSLGSVPSSQSYTYATSGTTKLSSYKPVKAGYTFLGWSLSNTATSASYSAGQNWNLSNGNNYTLYAVWKINTYTFNYNANGGTGSMSSQNVNYNSSIILSDNAFKREGYKFIGWNAYRHSDSTWYVTGQGWLTEDEIIANGHEKKLYENQTELSFNNSWISGDEYSIIGYTMYAVWEISGVVYIDNGTSFEPYLAYIDDGTNWNLYLMYVDDGIGWNIIS